MQTFERENSHAEKKVALYKRPFKAAGSYIKDADKEIGARHGKKTQFAVRALSLGLSLMTARGISETTNDAFFAESRMEAAKSLVTDTLSLPVSLGKLTIDLVGDGFDKLGDNIHFGSEGNSTTIDVATEPTTNTGQEDINSAIPVAQGEIPSNDDSVVCYGQTAPVRIESLEDYYFNKVAKVNAELTGEQVASVVNDEGVYLNPTVPDLGNPGVNTLVVLPTDCQN